MSTAVANPGNQTRQLSLRQQLESDEFKASISKVLPKHVTPDRMVRVAIMAMTRTPKLRECEPASFFLAMMNLSAWGLEPDGRRAHLIPFENKRRGVTECQLIIDYKGLAELVLRSGLVSNIHADVVCENDEFEYDRGEIKLHRINFRQPRGEAYAAYCLVRMRDGSEKCEVLTKEDILAIRDRSQGWIAFQKGWSKQSPWDPKVPHSEREMWKKTAFRRVSKWLPLSAEIRDAAEIDDDAIDGEIVQPTMKRQTLDDLAERLAIGDESSVVDEAIDPPSTEGESSQEEDGSLNPKFAAWAEQFSQCDSKLACNETATKLMAVANGDAELDEIVRLKKARLDFIDANRGERSNQKSLVS